MDTASARSWRAPARDLRSTLVGAALAFALSPLLVDLARHLVEVPWTRYVLVFPPLLLWQALRAEPAVPAPRLGWSLVALALLWELVAVGGGVPRFGRPALALALFGLCRALGLASPATAALALWTVPIPALLHGEPGSVLAAGYAEAAAGLLPGLSAELGAHGVALLARDGGRLAVDATDGGVALAVFLAGLGWLRGLRTSGTAVGSALRAGGLALAALPLQLLCVGLAASALATGRSETAASLLAVAPWLLGGALGAFFVLRPRRLHQERARG